MKKAIIGAGPAGLYTAIKLRKAGVRDVVVYDPRAGNYTRPGHLNPSVFAKAQKGLNIDFWPEDTKGHIRDLEKALYNEAMRLGIKIEKKRFVRLYQDAKKPGVVVESEGLEETVEANYVFDCTGTRRQVVAAVNQIEPDSPLKLATITELPVRNHFLAYVKINKHDWERFQEDSNRIRNFPETLDAVSYSQSIIKLRALGWKEFKFPRCYGVEFGKDKVCLYLHAPENLSAENYNNWVQTVLECYTSPIHYDRLPQSPKPRFLPFPASAQALQEVSYKGKNLPTVITLGDAQIDFDYYLAHGIRDGMERIDALFEHMEAFDNEIHYFDSAEYLQTINKLLVTHKKAVTEAADSTRESFVKAFESAQLKFRQASLLSNSNDEKVIISEILKEIEARQSYIKACKLFTECHNKSNQVMLSAKNIEGVIAKLNQIQADLIKANTGLPASFAAELKKSQELLTHLAASWKEVGNARFQIKKLPEAIDAYKKALEIYNLNGLMGNHLLKELPIYSNLAIVYLQSKLYSEAIAAANTALSIFDSCSPDEQPTALQEKIIFNLIKALCAQAQEFLLSEKTKDAKILHLQATNLICTHESKLTSKTVHTIKGIIDELQQRLPARASNNVLNGSSECLNQETAVSPEVNRVPSERPVSQPLSNWGIFANPAAGAEQSYAQIVIANSL